MKTSDLPEVWLRGASPEFTVVLQPVAHALLQAREEVTELMLEFNDALLWVTPAGMASVGFHLQHLAGVADRLFTYARGEALTDEQLQALKLEKYTPFEGCGSADLVTRFNSQVERCLEQLRSTPVENLTAFRVVGRSRLPSTVIGLLVHCAEHTMRHLGQLLVTVKVVLYADRNEK